MTAVIVAVIGVIVAIFASFFGGYKYRKTKEGKAKSDRMFKDERDAAEVVQKANKDVEKINSGDDPAGDTLEWVDGILKED